MKETLKVLVITERADWLTLRTWAEAEGIPAAILLGRIVEAWVAAEAAGMRASLSDALDRRPGAQRTLLEALEETKTLLPAADMKEEGTRRRRTRK